jgi:hypothetical protein
LVGDDDDDLISGRAAKERGGMIREEGCLIEASIHEEESLGSNDR